MDLNGLLRGVVDQVRPFMAARHLHLRLDVAPNLGSFEIDADKISTVFVNLLTNAIKFTPDNGQIELAADLDKEVDGPGSGLKTGVWGWNRRRSSTCFSRFSPSLIPAVTHRATSASANAGLVWGCPSRSSSSRCMEAGSWRRASRVAVRESPCGCHAAPAHPARSYPSPPPYRISHRARRRRPSRWLAGLRRNAATGAGPPVLFGLFRENVRCPQPLIVEDEPEANKLMGMLLRLRGYQTQSAFTAKEALELVEEGHPDIIFLDLMLPDLNGHEVCRILKLTKGTTLIPLVIVTARVAAENRMESFRFGADDYIAKPYTPDQIFQALEQAIEWLEQAKSGQIQEAVPFQGNDDGEIVRRVGQLRSLVFARTSLDLESASASAAPSWRSGAWPPTGPGARRVNLRAAWFIPSHPSALF